MTTRMFTAALGLSALGLSALGLATSAAAAGAAPGAVWQTRALKSGTGCYTATFVADNVMLGYHYMPKEREFRIVAADKNWDDLVASGDQHDPIAVQLATPSGPLQLTSDEGHVMSLGQDMEAVGASWYGDNGSAAQKAVRKATSMTIGFRGKTIATLPLDGTPGALDALMDCAAGLSKS